MRRFAAFHKKSWAVIDRPYSLEFATVGALYERPRCIFCAKPQGGEYCGSKTHMVTTSSKTSGETGVPDNRSRSMNSAEGMVP